MQIDLDEALFYSKLIIKNGDYYSGVRFRKYSEGFLGTTEYIGYYLAKEQYKKDKALTVLSSGDHIFNLAFNDVKEIDAFDINRLQYFVYHLRKAMIECLSYEEFIDGNACFFSVYLDEVGKMLEKVKKHLSEDVYEYYRKIFDFARKCGRLENLYNSGFNVIKKNAYLENEDAYLSLKEKLKDIKVNLYFGNATDITDNLSGGYNIILLSNISDYLGSEKRPLTMEEFRTFIDAFYSLLSDDGILINYLYGFKDEFLIKNSIITRREISSNNLVRIGDINQGYYRVRKIA